MTVLKINDGWAYRRKRSSFAELSGNVEPWREITLPHDALIGEPRDPSMEGGATGYFRGGRFEYRRPLVLAEGDRGKRVTLIFDGVYRDAMVYVNDSLAGRWAYGYSRFRVRADPYLRFDGTDVVRVECRAHLDSRWYTGAGIHRDAFLQVQGRLHVVGDTLRVTTLDVDDDLATIEVAATVRNDEATTRTSRLAATIARDDAGVAAGDVPVTLLPGEEVVVRQRLYVERPARWSPDDPSLYHATLTLRDGGRELDADGATFGIRTVKADPKRGLRINDRPVKLRGACIHHDNGVIGAAAVARADERRIELLKAAGFNAIRSGHNPASRATLAACDRLGILVMDETFDVWNDAKSDFDYAFEFGDWWERDVEAMIARDYNHPSVILYSIGNEILETGKPFGGGWSRRVANKVRALDPTRLVTNGVNIFLAVKEELMKLAQAAGQGDPDEDVGINTMMDRMREYGRMILTSDMATDATEESFAALDVAGMNYAPERYELDATRFPNRIIAGTETTPPLVDELWAQVKANDHVIGDFTWTGWDYLGEAGVGGVDYIPEGTVPAFGLGRPYPWLTAAVGDFDITGGRRPASFYRQIVYGLATGPYIAVHRPAPAGMVANASHWTMGDLVSSWDWEGRAHGPLRVEVYAAADEVELLLGERSLGRARTGATKPFRAEFAVPFEPGTLTAVAYSGGVERGRAALTLPAGAIRLRAEADRTRIGTDPGDAAFVTVRLTDGAGTGFVNRDRRVSLAIAGPAVLLGFGGADPRDEEGFTAPVHTSWNGSLLGVVRATGTGEIVLRFEAEDCEAAEVRLLGVEGDLTGSR